ncbi:MAG TPA: RNA-binding protein, partial [Polyangium sp.]|nr:RNA-binding protein [Polyangium sp.]
MAEDSRKLFVAGLPDSITEDVLRGLFEATGGNVVEVSLPKDRATGRPRGFGFVTLATSAEANAARESLDGSFQGGKSISVRPFQAEPPRREAGGGGGFGGPRGGGGPGGDRGPGGGVGGGFGGGPGGPAGAPDRTLYVGNLPYDASVEEVEAMITSTGSGPVVRVHLPMDADGRKRGFGFVTMASAEAAKGAIDGLRGVDVR